MFLDDSNADRKYCVNFAPFSDWILKQGDSSIDFATVVLECQGVVKQCAKTSDI